MSRNIFSVESFALWLETKNPKKQYKYDNGCACLIFQYFKEIGLPVKRIYSTHWEDISDNRHMLPFGLDSIAEQEPHSFGGALKRAQAMLD